MTKAIYIAPEPARPAGNRTAPPVAQPDVLSPAARHEALRRLVDQGVISASQADAVQHALGLRSSQAPTARRAPWAEIAGYLGGGLLLTGVITLLATSWEDLTRLARTSLVAVFAVLLLGAGTVAADGVRGLATARRRPPSPSLRLAGALLALGSVATAFAVGVALPDQPESDSTAIAAAVGLLVSVAGYVLLPTSFGLLASAGLGLVVIASTLDSVLVATSLSIGLGWFGLGVAIGGLTLAQLLRQPRLGLGLGAAIALLGAQVPLGDDGSAASAYVLTLALGAGCLALSRWVRTPVLLVFGVVAVTLAVPEIIWDATNGTVGAAAVLLIAGAVLLAASGYGFHVHRSQQRSEVVTVGDVTPTGTPGSPPAAATPADSGQAPN